MAVDPSNADVTLDGVKYSIYWLDGMGEERVLELARAAITAIEARARQDGASFSGSIALGFTGGVDATKNLAGEGAGLNYLKGPLSVGAAIDPGLGCYLYSDGGIAFKTNLYPTPLAQQGQAIIYNRQDDVHRPRVIYSLSVPPQAAGSSGVDLPVLLGPNEAEQQGLIAQTFDPLLTGAEFNLSGFAGDEILVRFLCRRTVQVSNLIYRVTFAGVTLTNCFIGIRSASGTLLGQTADLSSVWTSTGTKTSPLAAPVTLVAGTYYYATLLCGSAATNPGFAAAAGSNLVVNALNVNLAAGAARFQILAGSATSLVASITMASATATEVTATPMPWFGVL